MKNYKQIIEAINRGIKFALDDYEDDNIQGQVSGKVKYQNGINEYIDLMNETVDLGLPSETLWCKYNLGVDPNQLSNPEDWYGNYYAWGELEGNKTNKDSKIYFSQSNYKYGKDYNKLTKYCNDTDYGLNGFTDNLTELLPEDDAAYQNKKLHNFKFRIPSNEQFEELINYTKNYWVNNYNPNKIDHTIDDDGIQGLNGRVFEGKNKNQLFIPAAGFCNGSAIYGICSSGSLWSSSLLSVSPDNAYYLYFNTNSIGMYNVIRFYGFTIRPVINL